MRTVFALALCCSVVLGCAAPKHLDMGKAAMVKPGMTKTEVVNLLGIAPNSVYQYGTKTVMTWTEINYLGDMKMVSFHFDSEGKVIDPSDEALNQQKKMIDYMAQKKVGVSQ